MHRVRRLAGLIQRNAVQPLKPGIEAAVYIPLRELRELLIADYTNSNTRSNNNNNIYYLRADPLCSLCSFKRR